MTMRYVRRQTTAIWVNKGKKSKSRRKGTGDTQTGKALVKEKRKIGKRGPLLL